MHITYAIPPVYFESSLDDFSSIQSLSRVWIFVTPWTAAHQVSLSITSSRSPPNTMSIELVMASNHLILCLPLLLLPSIFPSIRVFSNESALLIRWPKYWSFSFNISFSNKHPGLIRMDWLDLLAVQGTLKSLLQHHSSKASILLHSAESDYMTTWLLDHLQYLKLCKYHINCCYMWQIQILQLELPGFFSQIFFIYGWIFRCGTCNFRGLTV